MVKELTLYSTPECPYCIKIKDWMKKNNLSFKEINVAEDEEAADKMIEESGQMGVPVLKITEGKKTKKIIVGYDIKELETELI